jgi:hypothetical protein
MVTQEGSFDYIEQVREKYGDSAEKLSEVKTKKVLIIERGRVQKPYVGRIERRSSQKGDQQVVARVVKNGVTELREDEERVLPQDTQAIPIIAARSSH